MLFNVLLVPMIQPVPPVCEPTMASIPYVTLHGTGDKMPIVGLGTWKVGLERERCICHFTWTLLIQTG